MRQADAYPLPSKVAGPRQPLSRTTASLSLFVLLVLLHDVPSIHPSVMHSSEEIKSYSGKKVNVFVLIKPVYMLKSKSVHAFLYSCIRMRMHICYTIRPVYRSCNSPGLDVFPGEFYSSSRNKYKIFFEESI
jgi:hypothetical protein